MRKTPKGTPHPLRGPGLDQGLPPSVGSGLPSALRESSLDKLQTPQGLSFLVSKWVFPLDQRPPTFLAPGTSFVEDNFSTDGRGCGGFRQ